MAPQQAVSATSNARSRIFASQMEESNLSASCVAATQLADKFDSSICEAKILDRALDVALTACCGAIVELGIEICRAPAGSRSRDQTGAAPVRRLAPRLRTSGIRLDGRAPVSL